MKYKKFIRYISFKVIFCLSYKILLNIEQIKFSIEGKLHIGHGLFQTISILDTDLGFSLFYNISQPLRSATEPLDARGAYAIAIVLCRFV